MRTNYSSYDRKNLYTASGKFRLTDSKTYEVVTLARECDASLISLNLDIDSMRENNISCDNDNDVYLRFEFPELEDFMTFRSKLKKILKTES